MDFVIFVIDFLFSFLFVLFALCAIVPWLPEKFSAWFKPVQSATEPILSVFRQALPVKRLGLDISPFIVILLLWIIQRIIMLFLI